MKTIGQFAKENNITVKTLHHYEKMELIKPFEIDESSGYRYYDDSQTMDIKLILYLKELGLSLSEIKKILQSEFGEDALIDFLNVKIDQTTKDKINAEKRYHKLINIVDTLNTHRGKTNYKELLSMSEEKNYSGKHGRRLFIEEAENMFNKAKQSHSKLCVVDFDLDFFTNINEDYGYEIGDIVIDRTQSEIISCLQELSVRTLFERSGGDEFHLITGTGSLETAKIVTKILNRVVAVDYSDVADGLKIGITAGIASLGKKTVSYSELVSKAAMQLYNNKIEKRK